MTTLMFQGIDARITSMKREHEDDVSSKLRENQICD